MMVTIASSADLRTLSFTTGRISENEIQRRWRRNEIGRYNKKFHYIGSFI